MGNKQALEVKSTNISQWNSELNNLYENGQLELRNGNKSLAIQYFSQCIELEENNSNIIDKRFDIMTEIILLQTEMTEHIEDNDILQNFKTLLHYYNAQNPTELITTNNLKHAIIKLFYFMRTANTRLMLKLADFTSNYFKSLNIKTKDIESILDMLQNEFINDFDTEYYKNIQKCDKYALYNAINDKNKIVIDLSDNEKYLKLHMNDSINLEFNKCIENNDELIFNILYEYIRVINIDIIEIYCYFHDNKDVEIVETDIMNVIQKIQKIIWDKLVKVIPCHLYECEMDIFYNQYPFLCESGAARLFRSRVGYPNQIINDKLYLGSMNQAQNINMLKELKISHIVNCTETEYKMEENIEILWINVDDNEAEKIDEYFEIVYKFINSGFDIDGNRILVHCRAGVSRSSTIVIAFLMKKYNMSLKDAKKMVSSKRSKIKPNEGFMGQLQKYERMLQI